MTKVALTDRAVQAAKALPGRRLELHDAQTPGLTLRVTDRGVKTWALRYKTPDGRSARHKLGDAKRMGLKAARLEAGRLKDMIDKGIDPLAEKRAAREVARAVTIRTFDDLLSAYWTACEAGTWKPKRKKKRASTIAFEKRLADRHIPDAFRRLLLADVTKGVIENRLSEMIAAGIGAQTNRTHAIIRQVFAFGLAKDHVSANPAQHIPALHDQEARRVVWTDAHLRRLWTACESPDALRDDAGKRVYVARSTAIALQLCALLLQRRTEIAGMTVEELDLKARTWTIAPARMKGGRPHQVPLPDRAVELIEEALRLAQVGTNEAVPVVFPSPRDKSVSITPGSLSKALAKIRLAASVGSATVHDLRRTGSSILTSERLGVSPFIRSKVLGHSGDTGGGAAVSVLHYDVNEYVPEKRRAVEAWTALLLEIVGERKRPDNVQPMKGAA